MMTDHQIIFCGVAVLIAWVLHGLIELYQENSWEYFNDWYDINGRLALKLNVERMINSDKWKQQMEGCRKLREHIESTTGKKMKDGTIYD